jgi:tetratricopeptide (TPR) repeat protein
VAQAAEACRNGSQRDCIRAGDAYLLGKEGVPKDPALALPLLSKACEGGEMVSCANVGVAYETGDGVATDLPKSGEYYARACDGGVVLAGCGNLGRFYDLGEVYELAEPAYGKVCALPNQRYCQLQGQVLFRLGRVAEALPLFEGACAADVLGACAFAGYIHAGRENWDTASVRYTKACRLGETGQCAYASRLAADIERRREWHAQRAAERAEASKLIASGNIAAAADYAVYQLRSAPLAGEVVQTAMSRRAMGAINTQTLYVLASWFRSGPVSAAVNAQLRARGTGLEGTFGTGTNAPGAAEARWRAANGGSASAYGGYRPAASSVPSPAPMGSSLSAAEQTRRKYRTAHCEMRGSNRNAAVCQ